MLHWLFHYRTIRFAQRPDFYLTREWRSVRWQALCNLGWKCQACGRSPKKHGIVLHVDHVLPKSKYPWLALSIKNLGILCQDCNLGKSDRVGRDYRHG